MKQEGEERRDEEGGVRDGVEGGRVRGEGEELWCAGGKVRDEGEGVRDEGGKVSDEEGEVRELQFKHNQHPCPPVAGQD